MKGRFEKHHSGTLGSASESNAFDGANRPTAQGDGTLGQDVPRLVQHSNNIDLGRWWNDERQTNAGVNYRQTHFDKGSRVGTRSLRQKAEWRRLSEIVSQSIGAGENIRPSKR